MNDTVNHPSHYLQGPKHSTCGKVIETIDISEYYTGNVAQAIQYLMRHKHKNGIEDLRKAAWFATREAERLSKVQDDEELEALRAEEDESNGTW